MRSSLKADSPELVAGIDSVVGLVLSMCGVLDSGPSRERGFLLLSRMEAAVL